MAEIYESIHSEDIGPVIGKFTANGALVDGIDIRSMESVRVSNQALRYEFVASKARYMQDAERGVAIRNAYAQGPEALAAAIGCVITDETTPEGKQSMDMCRELIALREKKKMADGVVVTAPTVETSRTPKERLEAVLLSVCCGGDAPLVAGNNTCCICGETCDTKKRKVHSVSIAEAMQIDNENNLIIWRPEGEEIALVVEG